MTVTVENEIQSGTSGDVISPLEAELMLRRRQALEAFLRNPDEAVGVFPDLMESLRIFFTQSTNPYSDGVDSCAPKPGSEDRYEEWQRAAAWFAGQYPDMGRKSRV